MTGGTGWYCTACGGPATPFAHLTLIDQAARYSRGRHCGGKRDLTTDPDLAARSAAAHLARLAAARLAELEARG